nr:PREDICTED: E3 ubiquitin-protein ligase TRIM9 isoform X2 [Bemisia tabaci]
MEDELKCHVCKQFFNNPVLLPCYHALCLNCAVHLQQPVSGSGSGSISQEENSGSSTDSTQEVDKLSILSETDSGVVCNSRPNSYVGTPSLHVFPSSYCLPCPQCAKLVYFDEGGVANLPKYRAMQNIIDKYGEARRLPLKCQLCEGDPAADATVLCEQCEIFYCDACREGCHPMRGPLAKHNLLEPGAGKAVMRVKSKWKESQCAEHEDEALSLYCLVCKVPVCASCLHDTRHHSHDVQAINAMCKAQKKELSQHLQQLSEKARSTTEFIQRLKSMTEKLNENCVEFEATVSAKFDKLVEAIVNRKKQLLEYVRQDRDVKQRTLKDQVTSCTCRLQHTTALLQFCIEALKETDSAAFLQVGSMLIARVGSTDMTWHKDSVTSPRLSPHLDLTLDDKPLLKAIEQLNFIQMKPPGPPTIIAEECSAENNGVTLSWQPPHSSYVEGYVLELDDGNGGDFREVYCGTETVCTVDGLHFNSTYNARVKAFNNTGEGEYSDLIGLQTAEVAWFTLDPCLSHPDIAFSADQCTITCEGYEHRVALGSVGFSRGVHYWEFSIDKYDSDTDPSFGIARLDVCKHQMLGKDDKGWSMYIDKQRSWLMHDNAHGGRCEGGIQAGSTVGVLLDLDRHQLSFYVNEELQGGVAFHDLFGVFYPAISINRGVTVTLHTAIEAPSDSEEM